MMRRIGAVKPNHLEHAFPAATRANATMPVEMAPNLVWKQGQVLGQITATKAFGLYDDTATDGRQVAKVIAAYSGKTDGDGRVFLGEDETNSPLPMTGFDAPIAEPTLETYYGGPFFVAHLIGLDAAAIVDFGGRLINGILLIPS